MYKVLLIIVSLALLAVSCGKEPDENNVAVGLRITPLISSVTSSDTRAMVEGATFATGHEVGFVILGSEHSYRNEGLPHLDGYGNVLARKGSGTDWLYYTNGTQYIGPSLPGMPSYGNVDIFGYYPYLPDFTPDDRFAMPYNLGTISSGYVTTTANMVETDYMYATPKINFALQAGQPAQMTFHHIMTCLEFRIYRGFLGPAITVATIDFTIEGNNRKFSVSGTYDATTGVVTPDADAMTDRILVNYNKTIQSYSSNGAVRCLLILPALDCAGDEDDATITAHIRFVGQDEELVFREVADTTYKFKLSEVTDSGLKGLRTGRHYRVAIKIEDFVKYGGVPTVVYPDWGNNQEDTLPNII